MLKVACANLAEKALSLQPMVSYIISLIASLAMRGILSVVAIRLLRVVLPVAGRPVHMMIVDFMRIVNTP